MEIRTMNGSVPGQFYLTSLLLTTLASSASAQIIPDASLPVNSRATVEGNRITIDAGTAAGTNLFHSFDRFDVPTGTEAFFNNNGSIDNILTRITGGSISNIDGLVRANGTANLFLINPNGIVFGSNASLDIGGSFVGSSASGITFGDGLVFSATNAAEMPLLAVNVPVGLQFGNSPGNIVNRSVAGGVGLQVLPGNTLGFLGGEVNIEGGILTVPAGRVAIAGAVDGEVGLTVDEMGFGFDYSNISRFGDLELSSGALVEVSGAPSGEVDVRGQNIRMLPESKIVARNVGSEAGGTVTLTASDSFNIVGTGNYVTEVGLPIDPATDFSNPFELPTGIFTVSLAEGRGGDININTRTLDLSQSSFINAIVAGVGNGGNLTINASESVNLSAARLDAVVAANGLGNGGDLTLRTQRLSLQDVAIVDAGTIGAGNGGSLDIEASESVELTGTEILLTQRTDGESIALSTVFFAATDGAGNAGELRLTTGRLVLRDGAAIFASSTNTGQPGNATITATESIELIGTTPDRFEFPSSIQASSFDPRAEVIRGGNITIVTDSLTIRDGASLTSNNLAPGAGGTIDITADSITLDNGGLIEVQTAFGSGGNIILRTNDLRLFDDSQITATSGSGDNPIAPLTLEERAEIAPRLVGLPQDGGNVTIETDTLVALENSDIIANSQAGFGGQVNITATAIFGTEFRDFQTSESDITASSALGSQFSGTVELRTPDIDATSGALALDPEVFDRSLVVTDLCQILSDSEFYVTGRGGIPENPRQFLEMQTTLDDLGEMVPFSSSQETEERANVEERANAVRPYSLTEATTWTTQPDGTIALVNSNNSVAQLDRVDCETGQGDEMVSYRLQ